MEFKVLALPEIPSMIITWVSVFILYLILRHFLYKPVSDFIEARQERIRTNIDEAKADKEEAARLKEEYEEKLAASRAEGQEIIENARRRGVEVKEEIIEEARQEARAILDRATREIEREKEKAYEDLRGSAGELAILIASRLMEEEINAEKQEQLIDKFIDEVGSAKWQS